MQSVLRDEIRELRARFWSDRDPAGRTFAPLADAYRRAGELEEAAELVAEGTARLPDFAPGHLVSARVQRDRGDREGARRAFRRVLELDPENVEALREAAALAEETERTGEALELWQRVARLEPGRERLREHIRQLKMRHFGMEPPPGPDGDGEAPSAEAGPEEESVPPPSAEAVPEEESVPPASAEAVPEEEIEPPPSPEDEREIDEDEGPATEVYTRTMAELYVRQGLQERAIEVYRRLLEERPDDPELRSRLEELEAGGTEEPEPGRRPASEEPGTEEASGPAVPSAPAGRPGAAGDRTTEEDVEELAREWASGPESTGELSTPFAWSDEEATESRPGERPSERPSIASYFERMLEWDSTPAGEDDDVVPIEDLAPDGPSGEEKAP